MKDPESFEEFWPYYLRKHANPATRALHLTGTVIGIGCVARAVTRRSPGWLLGGLATAYGFAWAGHGLVEKNTPATFKHPLWSLQADFKMLLLTLTGELDGELRDAGVKPSGKLEKPRATRA